jgi:hypothetical protein
MSECKVWYQPTAKVRMLGGNDRLRRELGEALL